MLRSVESEHLKLTNGKIILEYFQPMRSRYLNVTDRQTDRRLCRSNTALFVASRGKNRQRQKIGTVIVVYLLVTLIKSQ